MGCGIFSAQQFWYIPGKGFFMDTWFMGALGFANTGHHDVEAQKGTTELLTGQQLQNADRVGAADDREVYTVGGETSVGIALLKLARSLCHCRLAEIRRQKEAGAQGMNPETCGS